MDNDTTIPPFKRCSRCGVEKPTTTEFFSKAPRYKYGLNSRCKQCTSELNKTNTSRQRSREYYYVKVGHLPSPKKTVDGKRECRTCKQWFPLNAENFHRNKSKGNGGYNYECIACAREKCRNAYYAKGGNPLSERYKGSEKKCPCCERWFPHTPEYFPKHTHHKNGLYPYCKECSKQKSEERARARGVESKEIVRKDGVRKCPLCQEWKPETSECFYRNKAFKTGLSNYCKECTSNRERKKYASNPVLRISLQLKNKEWAEKHPGRVRENGAASASRRRARERELPIDFTSKDWDECLEYWQGRCCICGKLPDMWHVIAREHWIAISDDREGNPGTVAWNIVPMCHSSKGSNGLGSCNQAKHKKDPVRWLEAVYGKKRATEIVQQVCQYFDWIRQKKHTI